MSGKIIVKRETLRVSILIQNVEMCVGVDISGSAVRGVRVAWMLRRY